jgi:hypothetical protein
MKMHLIAALIVLAAGPALAQGPYDGSWFATLSCGPTIYQGQAYTDKPFRVQIVDGTFTTKPYRWTLQNNNTASRKVVATGTWAGKITGNRLDVTNRVEYDDPEQLMMNEVTEMQGPADSAEQFTARGSRRQLSRGVRLGTITSGCQLVLKKEM